MNVIVSPLQTRRPSTITIVATYHVLLPVIAGATIYLSWRSPTLLVFDWLRASGFGGLIAAWRAAVAPFANDFPEWVLFSLPDVLWVYALTFGMMIVWLPTPGWRGGLWVASGGLIACGGEIGQAAGLVAGTYDHLDLFPSAIAALAAWMIGKQSIVGCNASLSKRDRVGNVLDLGGGKQ